MSTHRLENLKPLSIELLDHSGVEHTDYDETVTADDFDSDRSGGWGPGRYIGAEVSAEVAEAWNVGLAVAKARGLKGVEMMAMRLWALRGGDVLAMDDWRETLNDEWIIDVGRRIAAAKR